MIHLSLSFLWNRLVSVNWLSQLTESCSPAKCHFIFFSDCLQLNGLYHHLKLSLYHSVNCNFYWRCKYSSLTMSAFLWNISRSLILLGQASFPGYNYLVSNRAHKILWMYTVAWSLKCTRTFKRKLAKKS